jgi:hypothetical protein
MPVGSDGAELAAFGQLLLRRNPVVNMKAARLEL